MTILTSIAQRIYTTLKSVSAIKNKVFPLVANEGTALPFVTFERNTYSTERTKDGCTDGEISYTINVVSANYFDGLGIADSIISAVLRMPERPELTSTAEAYSDNGYIQTLNFSF